MSSNKQNKQNKENDNEMINEQNRLATFKTWKFKRGECTKEKMAQAGFYRISKGASDEVECFVCFVNLNNWAESDEPFKEHLLHSAECPFAKEQKAQNDLTVGDWIDILRMRNDKINEKRLEKMQANLSATMNQLAQLCELKKH